MEFIAVIIAVLLVQLWGSGAPLHRDGWYFAFCRTLSGMPVLASPALHMLACISLPVFAVVLVYYGIADEWWGLPKLLMLVLLLLYSLGRGDFRNAVENYAQAWRRGDEAAAQNLLQRFDDVAPRNTEFGATLHAAACERIFYRGFERMFAVLFWFVLCGPALAVAYRLSVLYRQRVVRSDDVIAVAQADFLLAMFEWLPARVLVLSFALVANIGDGLRVWIETALRHGHSARAYLYATGCAVLGLDVMTSGTQGDITAAADDELKQIQVLLNRSLVFWLVAIAVLQLLY